MTRRLAPLASISASDFLGNLTHLCHNRLPALTPQLISLHLIRAFRCLLSQPQTNIGQALAAATFDRDIPHAAIVYGRGRELLTLMGYPMPAPDRPQSTIDNLADIPRLSYGDLSSYRHVNGYLGTDIPQARLWAVRILDQLLMHDQPEPRVEVPTPSWLTSHTALMLVNEHYRQHGWRVASRSGLVSLEPSIF